MRILNCFIFTIAIVVLTNCVQKSGVKTVIVKLHVNGIKNIQSVGLRGNDQPLSWDYDMELVPLAKDSIYTATFSILTGYKFTEAKFTVNGQFELNESDNRKIIFSENDTTVYEAVFDRVSR
jgi:hypothetical protein